MTVAEPRRHRGETLQKAAAAAVRLRSDGPADARDGRSSRRPVLRADPRLQELPIVAMTAHALVEERERCLDAGMNDHVTKPIDPAVLFATLLRWAKPQPKQTIEPQATPVEPQMR